MLLLRVAFAFGTVTMLSASGAAPVPVTGQWGGDGVRLTLDAQGGRIEYECGAGTLDGPLVADAKGNFQLAGKHEERTPGPQAADVAPPFRAAQYRGSVEGDRMLLTVQLAGEAAPRRYQLVRGRNVKLIRCL